MVMVTARGTEPDRAAAESGCGGASIPGERCLGFARTYFNSHRRPPLKPLAKETTHNFRDRRGGVPQSLVPSAGVSSQLDPPLVESPEDDVHVSQIGGEGLEDGHERTVAAEGPAPPEAGVNDGARTIGVQAFTLPAGGRESGVRRIQDVDHLLPAVLAAAARRESERLDPDCSRTVIHTGFWG